MSANVSAAVSGAGVNTSLTVKDIKGVRFSKSSPGYSPVAVNSFLVLVQARWEGRAALSAAEVRAVVFRRPSLSSWGYDQDEVDDLKDRIASALTDMEAKTSR